MLWWMLMGTGLAGSPVLTPDPRGKARPDRHFDIERLALSIALHPEQRALDGRATYTLRRLSPGPLVLDQVDLDIEAVTAGGAEATWWTEGDTLRVEVPDGQTELTISWSATPLAGMYFRGTERGSPDAYPEVWTQGQDNDHRYWLPLYDHPDDRFDFTAEVEAPGGWEVLTNSGVTLPGYLIMIAAAPYDIHTHPEDSRFSVYVPPGSDETAVSGVLGELPEMTAFFEARTGVPYAWGVYRQVFVQRFLYGGMENTSATVQNMSLLQPSRVDDGAGDWTREVVAHELAHQWYGDLLTCRDWRERWLNEGFAEFMAGEWMIHVDGDARQAERVDEWLSHSLDGRPLAGRFYHPEGTPESGAVYSKGAAVLHALKMLLGEEAFWEGIRRYTRAHQHDTVITTDLQRALEATSGHNLDWFFQQWVTLGHTPTLKVSSTYAEGELTVRVAQDPGDGPMFTLPITVEVGLEDGTTQRASAWMDGGTLTVPVPLDKPPRYVAFSPDGSVIATVEQEQDPEAWAAQLDSPSAYARRIAIQQLADTDTAEPLAALLADTARPMLEREAAAAALGEQQAEAPLVAALSDPRPGIRAAAASALKHGTGAEATSALARAARRDSDPYVRAAALGALPLRDPQQALSIARRAMSPRDITEHRLATTAAGVLAAEGSSSDLRALLAAGPERIWRTNIGAAATLVARIDDGQERAARAIEPALKADDLQVRYAAAAALGKIGDEGSISPLQAMRRAETVGYVRDVAERSIYQIRAAEPAEDAAANELDARIKALEERLEAAEAELKSLQDRH